MCKRSPVIVAIAVALALLRITVAGAVEADQAAAALWGTYRIEFHGTSTLHDFDGSVPPRRFELHPLSAGDGWITELDVPVAEMSTGNSARDSNMRAMLEGDRYPQIHASFSAIEPAAARPARGDESGSIPFVLTIRDVSRPLVGHVAHWAESAELVSFDVRFDVSLAEFGLAAPSVLGLVRVGDRVELLVRAEVRSNPLARL